MQAGALGIGMSAMAMPETSLRLPRPLLRSRAPVISGVRATSSVSLWRRV